MTVLTSENRLVAGVTTTLPRVNLLPPEIAERRAFRKVQLGLGCGVLAAVAVVGLVYVAATHSLSSAQTDLDAATAQHTALTGQVAKYRDVTKTYADAAAAQTQLTTAMAGEVRYSQLLNDLSMAIPSNVWLKSISYAPAVAAPAAGTLRNAAVATIPSIATLNVSGVAFSHDDVAVWLDVIAGLKKTAADPTSTIYNQVTFSNSTEGLIGTRKTVTFTSTANVSANALSHRFEPAGG